jgi:hypothetical protein
MKAVKAPKNKNSLSTSAKKADKELNRMLNYKLAVDIERSNILQKNLFWRKDKPGFYNALISYVNIAIPNAFYVEGIIQTMHNRFSFLEHAWIEINNSIIELTLKEVDKDTIYYPIICYSREETMKWLKKTRLTPPLYDADPLLKKKFRDYNLDIQDSFMRKK